MKKSIKIIILIFVIFILLILSHPASPLRSAYSKHILMNDSVLDDFDVVCEYHKPTVLLGSTNPALSCLTSQNFGEEEQKIEIKRMGATLIAKGWTISTFENFHDRNITYYKDNLRINIQPYDSEPGKTDVESKLIIDFQHMTQIDYRK